MGAFLTKLLDTLYAKKLEVVLVGLENSGKTTLLNVLAAGRPVETCPTIGLNVKLVRKGGMMEVGGFFSDFEAVRTDLTEMLRAGGRYTRGCDVIIFVVDSHAIESIPLARKELHRLLEDRELATTPVLVVSNKIDLEPHVTEGDLIRDLNLDYVTENPWIVIPISALKVVNVDQVLQWLIKQGNSKPSS